MEITRHNYEEYFLLYVDNELNAVERKAVEVFVQENPDLEEELIMLQQSVLKPDEQLVFTSKKNLLKDTAGQGLVNENNYESYFVAYGDDELTNEEKDLVEQFVYKFPRYQAEFELIQQARLFPDQTITFPDKAYLYRTEEDDHKVVPFAWYRIAAAAVVLLVVGSFALYVASLDGKKMTGNPMASTENKKATEQKPAVANATDEKEQPVVTTATNNDQTTPKNIVAVKEEKNSTTHSNISKLVNVPQEKNQKMIIDNPVPEADNQITYARMAAKPVDVEVVEASYPRPAVHVNVSKHTAISEPAPDNAMVVVMSEETNKENSNTGFLTASVNKTPLRGFFRKVTRVIDKATSFEASENSKGGVRIANFEVALK